MAPAARVLRRLRQRSAPEASPRGNALGASRLVLVGEDGQQEYRFPSDGVVRIGRHPHNDIILNDALVSRWHATLWRDNGQYYVRDEGSVNGTLLNGSAVRGAAEVQLGDQIEIGGGLLYLVGAGNRVPVARSDQAYRAPRHAEPELGRALDEFTLLQEVGRGGMSSVYMARSPDYAEAVAIKIPNPAVQADREIMAKFAQEAEIGKSLRHHNIVRIYEFRQASLPPYMVMEYVEGGNSLAHRLDEVETVPLEEAVRIAAQVADALGYAHRQGVVHRDVKPGNILLAAGTTAKVSDFGIAKVLTRSTVTSGDAMWGTYRYMSSEQARGDRVDARSDLYSLGVVIYEMLTGRPPFVADSPWEVVHAHMHEAPLPPCCLNEHIPTDIEAVVLRALEKDPWQRYQTAEEMIAALQPRRWLERDRPEPATRASLIVLNGERQGLRLHLSGQEDVLGRTLVDPADPTISRQHARISFYQGACWLEDLGSTNGTFLHNPSSDAFEEIRSAAPLQDGDRFRIGGSVFRFEG